MRNKKKRRKEKKQWNREREWATNGIGEISNRPPAEYHFLRSRRFFTFSFSDYRRCHRLFKGIDTGWRWEKKKKRERKRTFLPSVSVSTYQLRCSRRARRDAPLLVLSFVKLDERSRLGVPLVPFFLPLRAVDGRAVADWEAYAMILLSLVSSRDDNTGKSVEIWRRIREEFAAINLKLFPESNCAEKATRGAPNFHYDSTDL